MTKDLIGRYFLETPEATFNFGLKIGDALTGGEVILLEGGLGAGKTLLTKGIMGALEFDIDEVTSPSFSLVNPYNAKFTVYHLDLWRIEKDAAFAVGLDEILEDENSIVIIEWSERLESDFRFARPVLLIHIVGDGIDQRQIDVSLERSA